MYCIVAATVLIQHLTMHYLSKAAHFRCECIGRQLENPANNSAINGVTCRKTLTCSLRIIVVSTGDLLCKFFLSDYWFIRVRMTFHSYATNSSTASREMNIFSRRCGVNFPPTNGVTIESVELEWLFTFSKEWSGNSALLLELSETLISRQQ